MPYLSDEPSAALLSSTSWHCLIAADDADGLAGMSHRVWRQATEARENGDEIEAAVLQLIGAATSLLLTEGAKPPFQPLMQIFGHGRSPALEDFGQHDVAALAAFANSAPSMYLRARLADVAATAGYELGIKEWRSGLVAAHAYIELSERHLLTDRRYEVAPVFRRGLHLAWVYCKNDIALRDRYWTLLTKAISDCFAHGAIASALALVSEVIERRRDLGTLVAPWVEAYATQTAAAGDHDTAARCFAWTRKLWIAAASADAAKRCHLSEGHHLVARADGPGPAIVRAHWLAQGIDVLRNARAPEAELSNLQTKLGLLQRYSLNDFGVRRHEIDVTDVVKVLEETLVGPSLFDSLMQMCFSVTNVSDAQSLRRQVIEQAERSFLGSLFGVKHLDRQGKVVGKGGEFDPNDEALVQQAMVHRLREGHLKFRAETVLLRCASRIFTLHHPSMFEIGGVVEASALIPPGHKESVARGLLAGINADWLEAATYLIPKVEPILRHLFQVRGINTLLARDGTQSEMILSDFLDHPEADGFLGPDLILELKTLLTHQVGYCLRHQWAHGLSDDDAIVNAGTVCLWWTLWRLVLEPWRSEYVEAKITEQSSAGDDRCTNGSSA